VDPTGCRARRLGVESGHGALDLGRDITRVTRLEELADRPLARDVLVREVRVDDAAAEIADDVAREPHLDLGLEVLACLFDVAGRHVANKVLDKVAVAVVTDGGNKDATLDLDKEPLPVEIDVKPVPQAADRRREDARGEFGAAARREGIGFCVDRVHVVRALRCVDNLGDTGRMSIEEEELVIGDVILAEEGRMPLDRGGRQDLVLLRVGTESVDEGVTGRHGCRWWRRTRWRMLGSSEGEGIE